MATLWKILTRRKFIDPATVEESRLGRVLNMFDLTALGVGSTLGVGMYVLVGKVAKDTAGPSVVLSFLIAAIASAFAGLCYAEFGARAPRAGSAYVYSYVCIGEFVAFVIGWNLILEYVIGSASVARGMSLYIDSLTNDTIKDAFRHFAPINVKYMSPYFDFLAFGITIMLTVGLAFGLKESSRLNNVVTSLNLVVVLFVIIAGSTKANFKNWSLPPQGNATSHDNGGFFPFGVSGMIKGAATCFYGFVGFDCIATTGEEVKNPQRSIPIAIVTSLFIVFLAYFGTSTVVTLMIPYYIQDVNSPIPFAFETFGWEAAKWIVTIGGIFALFASLFGAMFPLPRIIYAMASDGLLFKFLGQVSAKFSTPLIGTLFAGVLTGLMAALFEQGQLVDMMSIGTLQAYTIVAACVLLLRYSVDNDAIVATSDESTTSGVYAENENTEHATEEVNIPDPGVPSQIFNLSRLQEPTRLSEKIVTSEVCIYCILCLLFGICMIFLSEDIFQGVPYAIILPTLIVLAMITILVSIGCQPVSRQTVSFQVPCVPLIPALSIVANIYLMLLLDVTTWIRFGVWMALGLPIYIYSANCCNKNMPHRSINKNDLHVLSKMNTNTNHGFVNESNDNKGSCNSDSAYFEDNESDDKTFQSYEQKKVLPDLSRLYVNDLRKVSIDTVSNNSNIVFEENVVAIIHREDDPILEEPDEVEEIPVIEIVTNLPLEAENKNVEWNKAIVEMILPNETQENVESVVQDVNLNAEAESIDVTAFNKDRRKTIDIINDVVEELERIIQDEEEKDELVKFEIKSENEVIEIHIPTPPPMKDFEYFTRIPRLSKSLRLGKRHSSLPDIPPADYEMSDSEDDLQNDEVIKIGSSQYNKLKDKLDVIFINKTPQSKLTKPTINLETVLHVEQPFKKDSQIIRRDSNRSNSDDKGRTLTKEEIKSKLNNLLRMKMQDDIVPSVETTNLPFRRRSLSATFPRRSNHASPDLEDHKKLMQNTLNSIKLRKHFGDS